MASYRELTGALAAMVRAIETGSHPPDDGALVNNARRLIAEARRGDLKPAPWTPFARASAIPRSYDNLLRIAGHTGMTVADIKREMAKELDDIELWVNNRYQVLLRRKPPDARGANNNVWLSIKRIDQEQIHSWRDLQRVKNELVGRECEAVELYPAESRKVDQSNQYHLWAMDDPQFRFPIGFSERAVSENTNIGEGQTPFAEGEQ